MKRVLGKYHRTDAKKKICSRFGQIEISKQHVWSESINSFSVSPYLQELQVYGGQNDNYEASVNLLNKYLRLDLNSSQMERISKHYAECIETQMQEVEEEQLAQSKTLVQSLSALPDGDSAVAYCMVDGCMIQTREGEGGNDWKEMKLGRIFTNADHYSLDKDHNWIQHSIYAAHLGDYEGFLKRFEPMVDEVSVLQEGLVFVADVPIVIGSWIWRWVKESYPSAIQILDFFHAMEHVAKFAKVYFKDEKQRKDYLDKQKIQLLNNRVQKVIEGIEDLDNTYDAIEDKRQTLLTYLKNNQERMYYKTYTEKGLHIGSGAIESAHRTVIQKRLKQSGQRWTKQGAQLIVNLRVVQQSGQWDRVVRLIKEQEIQTFNTKKAA